MMPTFDAFSCALAVAAVLWCSPARTTGAEAPSSVRLANRWSSYVFSTRAGLRLVELNNGFTGDNNLKTPGQAFLFVLTTGGHQLSAADFEVAEVLRERADDGDRVTFKLEHPDWEAELTVQADQTEETHWNLLLKSKAASPVHVEVAFPALGGLKIGETLESNRLYHGLNGGAHAQGPILLRGEGGYSFPLLDVYDISRPGRSGGVYLRAEDLELQTKSLEIQKQVKGRKAADANFAYRPEAYKNIFTFDDGVGMAVHYQRYQLEAGGALQMPAASIGVHPDRWERCWENYRRWAQTWYRVRCPRPQWWREVFAHRSFHNPDYRDGDHYPSPEMGARLRLPEYQDVWPWHFEAGGKYRDPKGIVKPYDDMAILNQWMTWRGDYSVRSDWGGASPFAAFLQSMKQAGARTALYMEAVCVERRSPVARAHGRDWPVLQNGERLTSEGNLREFNMCAGATGWRDFLTDEVAKVMRQARPDAIYLDSCTLRFNFCEARDHDHAFRRGWHASVAKMLAQVCRRMAEINPEAVLYSEFWSSDLATQFMSGCNSPAVAAGRDWEARGLALAPTGTDFFRFYFPDFKLIEITSEDETGFGLSLFNGNGIHGAFRSPEAERLLEHYHRIWRESVDCFTSADVQGLLETGLPDVHLNRFGTEAKQLYTVWNSAREDKAKAKIPVRNMPGARCIDVINGRVLPLTTLASGADVAIDLPARKLAAFALVKPVMKVKREGTRLQVSTTNGVDGKDGIVDVRVGLQSIARPLQPYSPAESGATTLRSADSTGWKVDIDLPGEATAASSGVVVRLLVHGRLADLVTLDED